MRSKIFRKSSEAVKWISGKQTIVYCRCTCYRHTLVFGIRKAWSPPIGAREIDGLPKASMTVLPVTKQDPNSCYRVGVKIQQIWRQCLWTTEILLTWMLYRNYCNGFRSEAWSKIKSLRKHAYSNILKILPPRNENFQMKISDIFHISAQNIDCRYSLEPPRRGGSNKYPQSMF